MPKSQIATGPPAFAEPVPRHLQSTVCLSGYVIIELGSLLESRSTGHHPEPGPADWLWRKQICPESAPAAGVGGMARHVCSWALAQKRHICDILSLNQT
ncbi:MAG: hypothetical protein KME26_19370 [Oscillatoria princeps RMCB-10]|nr:hypothetical protein [Oscillatoria princeps RMCB-10]